MTIGSGYLALKHFICSDCILNHLTPIGNMETKSRLREKVGEFWGKATFLPKDSPASSDILLREVSQLRQVALMAFALKLSVMEPEIFKNTGFADFFEKFKKLSSDERQEIVAYPPFNLWLKQTIHIYISKGDLRGSLAEFTSVLAAFDKRKNSSSLLYIEGQFVQVERYDIHPLIKSAALPDYKFPDISRQKEFEENVAYPHTFFLEMIQLAMERVKHAWPEAYKDFPKFVKIIVDMIDADFTSYSSSGHTGVIFVSTDNSPLVALEEYLIHELGHQILYCVMELDPIIVNDFDKKYRLPWSGQLRDFYGYFHAFYIYIFMARYLERVKRRSRREQKRISDRFSHILKGLNQAIPDLEDEHKFTPKGKLLFETLKKEVYELNREKIN